MKVYVLLHVYFIEIKTSGVEIVVFFPINIKAIEL